MTATSAATTARIIGSVAVSRTGPSAAGAPYPDRLGQPDKACQKPFGERHSPVRCKALLGRADSQSKCNTTRKRRGDLEYFAPPQTTKNEEEHMKYCQITSGERYRIAALRQEGYCPSAIARHLRRHRSTISRELRRNSSRWDGSYRPSKAQERTNGRRSRSRRNQRFGAGEWKLVRSLLGEKWSPVSRDVISCALRGRLLLRTSGFWSLPLLSLWGRMASRASGTPAPLRVSAASWISLPPRARAADSSGR
jgi:hypothetical protein